MRLRLSPGLALAFIVAGCGGTASVSPTPPSVGATASPAASKPAASAAPASAAASASAKPAAPAKPAASGVAAAAGTPIKVGLLEPVTGSLAPLAKDNTDGFNLYLESVKNTIAGRQIQVIVADEQNQADVAMTKAKGLVESDKVNILMGLQNTAVCYAIAGYVKDVQVPALVTGNCGAENATTDPKYKSPYFVRFTQNSSLLFGPPGDWAAKQGLKTAVLMFAGYAGGIEAGDHTAAAYVLGGGSIIQELHAPLGTNDFGPYLAKLDQKADALFFFAPGTDSLRFGEQFGNYVTNKKLQIIDDGGQLTGGPVLAQLKDKLDGVVVSGIYYEGSDSPQNKAFIQAWKVKYTGRPVSLDAAQGWAGAQILEAALNKVNGNIEDKQAFLNALYATNIETPKGPIKLDADHDVIENMYIYQIVKNGNDLGQKLLQTYPAVARGYARQAGEPAAGTLKDKWVGMTKDKLLTAK